jgi:hypothetical protein
MKTLMDGMTTSPSYRRRRIASLAASAIEQRIRSIGRDDRVDLPKERINSVFRSYVPYPPTKNAIVVVSTVMESDRAVANIRAGELLLTTKDEGSINDHDGMKNTLLLSLCRIGQPRHARSSTRGERITRRHCSKLRQKLPPRHIPIGICSGESLSPQRYRRCYGNFTHQSIVIPRPSSRLVRVYMQTSWNSIVYTVQIPVAMERRTWT